MSSNNAIETTILFAEEDESLIGLASTKRLSAPTVFTGQKLRGRVAVAHLRAQLPLFDTVQIVLKGKVKNIVRRADGFCWEVDKPLVLMSCVKVEGDFHEAYVERSNRLVNQASFFFDIPKSITVPTYEKHLTHHLPPSIRVIKKAQSTEIQEHPGAIAGSCDVAYHIQALLYKDGHMVCHTNREILLMPASETPPPLDPTDFRWEYKLFASSIASFWKAKKSSKVSVFSEEPRPVVFPTGKRVFDAMTTELSLRFETRQVCDLGEGLPKPPFTDCEVTVALEAITYFLQHEKERMMSAAETRRCLSAIMKKNRFTAQKRKLKLTEWKERDDSSGRTVEWEKATSLTTLLPNDIPRLPSFFSSLVSRRYAFDLQIVLGTKPGFSHTPIHLRVPVQIVHHPVGKNLVGLPEIDFGDELQPPAYVP